jgi:hypothetical protein
MSRAASNADDVCESVLLVIFVILIIFVESVIVYLSRELIIGYPYCSSDCEKLFFYLRRYLVPLLPLLLVVSSLLIHS